MSAGKWMRLSLLPILFSINGCATAGVRDNCAGFRPILLSKEDVLTRPTEDAILAHNEFGLRLGCFKAPR